MNSADKIKRLFKDAELGINPDTDEQVFDDVLQARQTVTKKVPAMPEIWRILMKNPITKLAIAAIVTIACMTGVLMFRETSGIALADVLARVEQVKAFRCKGAHTMSGQMAPDKPYQFQTRFTVVMSQEYGYKSKYETLDPNSEWIPDGELFVSLQKNIFIKINYTKREYMRLKLDDAEAQQYREEFSSFIDPGTLLKEIMTCRYESLGRSTIDGIDVEVFHTTDPNYREGFGFKDPQVDVKLWIDVKTHLPLQFEYLIHSPAQSGNMISQRHVLHDFEWDVPVDASAFEAPPIPEDYTIQDQFPAEPANEETAIQGLKRCIELFGNYFENISVDAGALGMLLSALEKSETPEALRLKEEIKELTGEEQLDRVSSAGKPIFKLMQFYIGLVQAKMEPAYYGKTVTPKDSHKVLLRWKVSDNEYRVIFGDLKAETVSADVLAELESTLQQ